MHTYNSWHTVVGIYYTLASYQTLAKLRKHYLIMGNQIKKMH